MQRTLIERRGSRQHLWDYGVLPSGDEGVRRTIALMSEYAVRDSLDGYIKSLASKFMSIRQSDRQRLRSMFEWIYKNVRYEHDGFDEYVRSPRHIITTDFEGDCDDLSTLFAALALAMGYQVWFKVIAWRPENQPTNPFTHVYNLVHVKDEDIVIPVDCVMAQYGFANEKSPVFRYMIFTVQV